MTARLRTQSAWRRGAAALAAGGLAASLSVGAAAAQGGPPETAPAAGPQPNLSRRTPNLGAAGAAVAQGGPPGTAPAVEPKPSLSRGTPSLGAAGAAVAQGGPPETAPAAEPTPRLPDGTPNLGRVAGEKGVWAVPYITNMAARAIGPDGEPAAAPNTPASSRGARGGAASEPHIPFMPWTAALYDYNSENESKYDPEGYCLPPGGPRMMATPYPMEIIQLPEQERIIMIFEGATHVWREIHMDGRPHPEGDALNPTFLGHSVGHWDGDTLVVDVVGFNETTWIDFFGHPHTDALHIVERFSRPDKNTLRYEATIDDPGAYTAPWTVAWNIPWRADGELMEYICQDNNLYLYHLTDDFGQPIFGNR